MNQIRRTCCLAVRCQQPLGPGFGKRIIKPDEWQKPPGGKLVGHGDFAAQAPLAFANLGRALRTAGARPEHVCKITIYIVDYNRDEHVPIIEAAQISLFGDHKPTNVVVGVAIMSPGYLIEVDAVAVID
jgi:enamine deaminase RidA (YjgF/YER057c/UK114 family)